MDKVSGVAECISHMWNDREILVNKIVSENMNLEETWKLLRDYPYMGPFMAYEVVTDLRHTYLLKNANDIVTWANAGPGAMRGLNRLTGRELGFCKRSHDWNKEMNVLYKTVIQRLDKWILINRPYEMREIEGRFCEFDKYSRIVKGEGRTRSIYKHNDLPLIEEL